jgi:hypothetical protein
MQGGFCFCVCVCVIKEWTQSLIFYQSLVLLGFFCLFGQIGVILLSRSTLGLRPWSSYLHFLSWVCRHAPPCPALIHKVYKNLRHLHTDVHHSPIQNSQALETSQMPYNWWIDQENMVCINNGDLLSHKE